MSVTLSILHVCNNIVEEKERKKDGKWSEHFRNAKLKSQLGFIYLLICEEQRISSKQKSYTGWMLANFKT